MAEPDTTTTGEAGAASWRRIGATLFLCLFAAQASVLVLSPVLVDIAREFHVSTAVAGQLRSLSGVSAGIVALFATRVASRLGLRRMVGSALLLLTLASALSAAAPTFATLALAQVSLGAALAGVLSGAVAAADAWPPEPFRRPVLSWALNGQPSAWIVGLPLIGLLASVDWRWALLVVPPSAAILALVVLRSLPRAATPTTAGSTSLAPIFRRRPALHWAIGELLAFAAWSGTLVFTGSLFVESYDTSPAVTAFLLGGGAIAYIPGNLLARHRIDGTSAWPLAVLAGIASLEVLVLGVARPSIAFSAAAFALITFTAGARTFAGSIRGIALAPDATVAATGVRAAATQFGYLLGASLGGAALAAGGYPGLAVMLSIMFALASAVVAGGRRARRSSRDATLAAGVGAG
jgi:predicted MFS family arabinose efflux permease